MSLRSNRGLLPATFGTESHFSNGGRGVLRDFQMKRCFSRAVMELQVRMPQSSFRNSGRPLTSPLHVMWTSGELPEFVSSATPCVTRPISSQPCHFFQLHTLYFSSCLCNDSGNRKQSWTERNLMQELRAS